MRPLTRLSLALSLAALAAGGPRPVPTPGYVPALRGDTARPYLAAERTERTAPAALPVGAEIEGFLSSRGLPPRPGRFVVTDTGLVFRSTDGSLAQTYPLVGPVRVRDGRRWRAIGADRELVVRQLAPGERYRCAMRAFSLDGPGPWSALSEPFRTPTR